MKGLAIYVAVCAVLTSVPLRLTAQSSAPVTVWKLNVAKSQFTGSPPQRMTRTLKTAGNVTTLSFEGIGPDGSRMSYAYQTKFDDNDNPVTGAAPPGTIETMAVKRIDAKTTLATGKKAGKVVVTATNVLSDDGKVLTATSHSTGKDGRPITSTLVWEKQ